MDVDLVVNANSEICLFHEDKIEGDFSWCEYDDADHTLHLVNEDGSQMLLVDDVDPGMAEYMLNATEILIVRVEGEDLKEGFELPIVIRKD